jgi:hypothetical protein
MACAQTASRPELEARGGAREIFTGIAGRRLAALPALMGGVAFGVAIWAVMTFGGLPLLNPMMRERVAMMPAIWFVAHVAFGMGVGSAPALRRRIAAA